MLFKMAGPDWYDYFFARVCYKYSTNINLDFNNLYRYHTKKACHGELNLPQRTQDQPKANKGVHKAHLH